MDDLSEELKQVYTHIERNEFKGGADARIYDMEVMPCMCRFEPGDDAETACGDNSDCINRALFLECSADDCPCGYYCLNRRFWNKQYASIKVIKTQLKGYGLKALKRIKKGQFVIEYCGEVIPQSLFMKRVREYSESGAKHFYFMSIKTDEVIDAYKKGNIARFMNHSCVPNCELQKWVVGNQIRMGFFALSDIEEGSELTFDYKFERYGSEPQICYCGEAACKGIIGGQQKTVISLEGGADDEYDEEEAKLSYKPRRRSVGDDDDDYETEQKYDERGLQTVDAVKSLVKLMLYSTAKPVKLIRLLQKLEATQNPALQRKFLQYHGLLVLKSCLSHYSKANPSICIQTMKILKALPAVSRNSIVDSKIEDVTRKFVDDNLAGSYAAELAHDLLEIWSGYATVYRIPKKIMEVQQHPLQQKEQPHHEQTQPDQTLKRLNPESGQQTPPESDVFSADALFKRPKFDLPPRLNSTPTTMDDVSRFGALPRSNIPFRPGGPPTNPAFLNSPRNTTGMASVASKVVIESVLDTLPKGWKTARNEEGRIYYYNLETNVSRWDFPRDADSGEVGSSTGSGGSGGSLGTAVMVEARAKSSIIEGFSEAELEAIMAKANADGGLSPDDGNAGSKVLRGLISEVVVKTLSKYKADLGSDRFKKIARKITHQILDKEMKKDTDVSNGFSEETKAKIKKYTKKWLESFKKGAAKSKK